MMGMFDDIIINVNLLPISKEEKDLFDTNTNWQTKSMDCLLSTFEITKEKKLSIIESGWGVVERTKKEIEHTGIINFYSSNKNGDWYEFYAKFIDGMLQEITGGKENID